jgi:hypothetical protein
MKILERIFDSLFELLFAVMFMIGSIIGMIDAPKYFDMATNQFIFHIIDKVILNAMCGLAFFIIVAIRQATYTLRNKDKENNT